jgi:hypothetical protein
MAVHQLLATSGARRRLRRDIAALVGRMREHLATGQQVHGFGNLAVVVTFERSQVRANSPGREPTGPSPRRDQRGHRQLTDRFGAELQRVLELAQTLGVTDAEATSAINAGLASTLTLPRVAASLEALARRI